MSEECLKRGCRNLEWRCKDCGRICSTAEFGDKWIKCSDRLPTMQDKIGYVYSPTIGLMSEIFFDRDDKTWFIEKCRWEEYIEVSHWMPLPELPLEPI